MVCSFSICLPYRATRTAQRLRHTLLQDECQTSSLSPETHQHLFSEGWRYLAQEPTSVPAQDICNLLKTGAGAFPEIAMRFGTRLAKEYDVSAERFEWRDTEDKSRRSTPCQFRRNR